MKTDSKLDYERRELAAFRNQKHRFFDSTADFAERLATMDLEEQIAWIENGSYGAGACLALREAVTTAAEHPRMNGRAHVGAVILHAFYGAPFTNWKKLPAQVQERMNSAVDAFRAREHDFAI